MSTLSDYEAARTKLIALNERWDKYSGNNPDKYRSSIRSAQAKIRAVEVELKATGLLPRTPEEELNARLDATFPKARSKQIVEYEGKKYVRRFTPIQMSNSGKTVAEWENPGMRCLRDAEAIESLDTDVLLAGIAGLLSAGQLQS